MSLPTTALANVRAVRSWSEKPFTEFNDTATTIYYFDCVCSQANYTPLTQGAKLSNAASAGLIAINYTDASARWIGDTNWSYSDGGYLQFTRRFSRVPLAHTDYSSTVVTLPPVFGKDREVITTTTEANAILGTPGGTTTQTGPETEYLKTPSRSEATRSRLEFKYSTNPDLLEVFTAGSFTVLQVDGFSKIIPSGDQDVLESTKITRWNGDIFEAVTAFKP